MKKQAKITLSLFLTLSILIAISFSRNSLAATNEFTDGIFTFTITDKVEKTVTLIKCTPDAGTKQLDLPSQVSYNGTTYSVTGVGNTGLDVFYHDNEEIYQINTIVFPESYTGTVTNFDSYLPELTSLVFEGNVPPSKIDTTRLSTVIYVPSGMEDSYHKIVHAIYEYSKSDLYETTFELEPNIVPIGTKEVEDNYFIKDKLIYQVIEKAGNGIGKVKLIGNYVSAVDGGYLKLTDTVTNEGYTYQITELGKISLCGSRLKWIFIPDSVTKIESKLLDDKVSHVFLSKNMKAIPTHLLTGENNEFALKYIYIPEGITTIEKEAFGMGDFHKVNSIIIPSSVTNIGENALVSIKNLVFMNHKPVSDLYKALGINQKVFRYGNSYAKDKVVKVANSAKVTYHKALNKYIGKATIKAKKEVTKATKLTVAQSLVEIKKGANKVIKVSLSNNKANEVIQWDSANTDIAKVSKNGTVTGVSKGTTYVLAYTQTSGHYQIIKITVK